MARLSVASCTAADAPVLAGSLTAGPCPPTQAQPGSWGWDGSLPCGLLGEEVDYKLTWVVCLSVEPAVGACCARRRLGVTSVSHTVVLAVDLCDGMEDFLVEFSSASSLFSDLHTPRINNLSCAICRSN